MKYQQGIINLIIVIQRGPQGPQRLPLMYQHTNTVLNQVLFLIPAKTKKNIRLIYFLTYYPRFFLLIRKEKI